MIVAGRVEDAVVVEGKGLKRIEVDWAEASPLSNSRIEMEASIMCSVQSRSQDEGFVDRRRV